MKVKGSRTGRLCNRCGDAELRVKDGAGHTTIVYCPSRNCDYRRVMDD